MRLLSGKEVLEYVLTPGAPLQIANFSPEHLQHTAYYVRLGAKFLRMEDNLMGVSPDRLSKAKGFLRFSPGEYVRVESHELFHLDSSVFGILGGVSDTARLGLGLVSGQFIDPLFPSPSPASAAPLEFGLKNESQLPAAIRHLDPVAKVCFFDVSDTVGIELKAGSLAETKFAGRLRITHAQLRAADESDDVNYAIREQDDE